MDTEGILPITDKEKAVMKAFDVLKNGGLYPVLRRMYRYDERYYIELGGYNDRPDRAEGAESQSG